MLSLLDDPTLTSIHDYWKNHSFLGGPLSAKCEGSLLLNMLCRFVKPFLTRSKHLLIPFLQSPFTVILEPQKIKSVYYHPTYLAYMQNTSCKMTGCMKHKLESRLLGEIPITSDTQMTLPYGRKQRRTKEPLDENERGE